MSEYSAQAIIDAFSGSTVFDKEPEVGEQWWVKFPGDTSLVSVNIAYISSKVATFNRLGKYTTYMLADVILVEEKVS